MKNRVQLALGVALALALAPGLASAQEGAAPSEADLLKSIGTKKDGWSPVVTKKLKAKMTPEETAKIFPGADKVSEFGFVEVPAEGAPGLAKIKFYFAKDKKTNKPTNLQSVTLIYDSKLTEAPGFYDALVKVTQAKYGKIKKKEMIEKKLITWVGPRFKIAQLSKFPERGGDVFQLNVSL